MQIDSPDPSDKQQEILRVQIQAVRSGHRGTILDALRTIRTESNVSILPELFELLVEQEDEEISREIISLLNDLKSEDAVPVLAEAVIDPAYESVAHLLVAACWQNGLSYGKYADNFIRAALEGSYQTALEAFSVMEEAVGDLSEIKRESLIRILKDGMLRSDDQKKILLRELVRVLEQY
jgi:HEAT repeat protein